MKITEVLGRQILDSRGNPTVECEVILEDGSSGRAAVPSGASTGSHEALELRDGNENLYQGKSVYKAVENVNTVLAKGVVGLNAEDQETLDKILIEIDGTLNKEKLGANAILSVSLATAHAAAMSMDLPLFAYLNQISASDQMTLPLPLMNIINGGKHAENSTDIQEFMILPVGAENFASALQIGTDIFHTLKGVLKQRGYATTVGDEGGYAPAVKGGNKEALEMIMIAVDKAGYKLNKHVVLGLDVAASELYKDGNYTLATENRQLSSEEMAAWLMSITKEFPVVSIEDGLAENDWVGWKNLTELVGDTTQLVGDDLFVTNTEYLQKGIEEKAGNAILIKPNQIGTLSETIAAVMMAKEAGWRSIISHRSGETEDVTIAHLAVGLGTGQIKTGSLSRTDRIAKYNELLRIESILGDDAEYAGKSIFNLSESSEQSAS